MELDLTEAIEAGVAVCDASCHPPCLELAVRAAAPIIERAVREQLGGICGDQAPRLVLVDDVEESGAGVICELHHGHPSEWHEAPNEFGPPMRWRPASITVSGVFDA